MPLQLSAEGNLFNKLNYNQMKKYINNIIELIVYIIVFVTFIYSIYRIAGADTIKVLRIWTVFAILSLSQMIGLYIDEKFKNYDRRLNELQRRAYETTDKLFQARIDIFNLKNKNNLK